MGVPALFSLIVRKYGNIIKPLETSSVSTIKTSKTEKASKYDNLYLDSNSVVYDCVHRLGETITDELLINAVCKQIHHYINQVKPSQCVFITFDGVAPVAKLENQRNRRYKTEFTNKILAKSNIVKKSWDTTAITPGTPFMKKLDKGIHKYFDVKNVKKQFGVENIMISTSVEHGEGEHKIFQYIRDNQEKHSKETVVVYGLDADLIMLSINHLRFCPNIYLYRETPHFIRSLNKNLNPGQLYTLDIGELFARLSQEMNDGKKPKNTCEQNRAFDYIFMTSLLGNDYIPHNPAFNIRTKGMNYIMNTYKSVIAAKNKNLTNGDKIDWRSFRLFIQELAKNEEYYLKEEYKMRDALEKRPFMVREDGDNEVIQRMNAIPVYNRVKEKYINIEEPMWEERYYRTLFDNERNEISSKVCQSYLEALEWTHRYYTTGCVDWRWSYSYHYAPLFGDLLKYIPVFDVRVLEEKSTNHNPVLPLTQLSYVLPKSAHHMLPPKLKMKLYENVGDNYSDNWEFEWSFCRYFWESHAKMKMFDIDYLEKLVVSCNITK
jgi:5'-3' exonuclease